MLKKLVTYVIATCVVFSLFTPSIAKAAEKPISSETIITEENIYEVLEFLGIDSSNFEKTDGVVYNNYQTVGEISKAIEQSKKQHDKKNYNVKAAINENVSAPSILAIYPTYGTRMVTYVLNCDAYTIEFGVAGDYRSSYWSGTYELEYHPPVWTGVGASYADIDSRFLTPVYKIDSKTLNATYNSFTITLYATVNVGVYIGIKDIGIIRTGGQTINSTLSWDAYNYIS